MKKIKILCVLFAMILSGSNAFAQWTKLNTGVNSQFKQIHFPTLNTGYVLDKAGNLLKTTDAGTNWFEPSPGSHFEAILFVTADTGFSTSEAATDSKIWKTVDGGVSWQSTYTFSHYSGLTDIFFLNTDTGYVLSTMYRTSSEDSYIFRTTDAGSSWQLISSGWVPQDAEGPICFVNSARGYLLDNNYLYKSTNGGVGWGSNPFIYSFNKRMNDIFFVNTQTGFLCGNHGSIFKTIDSGTSWLPLTNMDTTDLHSIHFTSKDTGFVAGGNGIKKGIILKTTDGGISWNLSVSDTSTLYALDFPDAQTGYAAGANGRVLKYSLNTSIGEDSSSDFSLHVFPNPSAGGNRILVKGFTSLDKPLLIVSNLLGQEIKRIVMDTESYEFLPGELMPNSYLVKLITKNHSALVSKMLVLE
jgi:photosystem II stability/assembly factor-like uncharacterized protein